MTFVIGNTLHTTSDGRLVEFDETGSSIAAIDPMSLSLAARGALTHYLEIYHSSQLAACDPDEGPAATKRHAASEQRKLRVVQDAAWLVEGAIWHDRTCSAITELVGRLNASQAGWTWDGVLRSSEPEMRWYAALGDPQGQPVPLQCRVFMSQIVLMTLNGMPIEVLFDAAAPDLAPTVRVLHEAAMERAERNSVAKRRHNGRSADDLIGAWRDEARAAAIVLRMPIPLAEPTRGILCSSAAFCGLDCYFFEAADTLIRAGLAGQPDNHTRMRLEEARTALDQARARWSQIVRWTSDMDGN
jgi:hypothetical protein